MGTDNLFWKKKRRLQRIKDTRNKRPTILIVCEGQRTEPNYFKNFRVTSVNVKIIGLGHDPMKLVNFASDRANDYDQIWCVFDRDIVPKQLFNAALNRARQKNIKVAYSNEAFELWYLLHFEYLSAGITRKQYCKKLNDFIGRKYKKNDEAMYNLLLDKQSNAIRNAK